MSVTDARDTDSRVRDGRYSIGIDVMDDDVLRGIPEGSTVAVIGDPQSMAQLFLYQLVETDRPTQYVSTLRRASDVREDIEKATSGNLGDEVTVEDTIAGTESTTESITKYMNRIEEGGNFVVDTMSFLRDDQDFSKLVREIYQNTKRKDGLTYLYFTATDIQDLSRNEYEMLHLLDGVFTIELDKLGDTIENHLHIYKLRDVDIPDEIIKLQFGQTLTIDTTRDIA